MRIPSHMNHNFSQVPNADIPRSQFDRSGGLKTTFDAGWLVPIFWDEALPGDTFNLNMTGFCRLATPLHPFMDNMYMDTFFFAVPERILWDNWQKFNGEQKNPGDSTDYLTPIMTAPVGGYANQSLSDYLTLPTLVAGYEHRSVLHRAYNAIYNEWFRDQNLQNSVVVDLDDGPDDPADYVLLRRGKRHDYFTSSLPWPQKGPSVPIPLTGNAPVKGLAVNNITTYTATPAATWRESGTVGVPLGTDWSTGSIDVAGTQTWVKGNNTSKVPNIYADLSAVTAATINSLRQSFQVQKLYERDARGGTRYTEILRSHFGVTSPDARLQRPEYLGGGSTPININPIAQTSAATAQPTPQGNLAAMGTAHLKGHGFTKSFTEHCIIIGLVNVRADLTYQNGLNRGLSRRGRFDFYWPALSHIGEQAVLNKEIYTQGTANPTQDAAVFGYQERFAEYRYKPSCITGKMRSNDPQTLDTWHLAQKFTSLPTLSSTFIVDNPPVARVIAVPTEPNFLGDFYFDYKCARPMPTYSVPGLIDHF